MQKLASGHSASSAELGLDQSSLAPESTLYSLEYFGGYPGQSLRQPTSVYPLPFSTQQSTLA